MKSKPATLTIATTSIPGAVVGTAYRATLIATGGTAPYRWTLNAGSMPAGLHFSNSGVINGTPTASASASSFTFRVADSSRPMQSSLVTLLLTVTSPSVTITTIALPDGQAGTPYSVNLAASGGIQPYRWSLRSGSLPPRLLLSPSGAIRGTPTTAGRVSGMEFQVTDSSTPSLTASISSLAVTIHPSPESLSIFPKRAALTITQSMVLAANAPGNGRVRWYATGSDCSGISCGTFSNRVSAIGSAVTYTAPAKAGHYTLTAVDLKNASSSSSIKVGVTDLAGVTTYHNNTMRNGVNSQEYALAAGNVTPDTFGKLFSCLVDGPIFAQPLWVPNLTMMGVRHNVIFIATEHDSLYAFDADSSPCTTLWHISLIDAAHGGTQGETPVPRPLIGLGLGGIYPEVGVTGTPVIDLTAKVLYVVSKSVAITSAGPEYYQRLHAIDLVTGREKHSGSPALISGSYPAIGSTVQFSPGQQNQRAGLALVNGVIYIAWGSHEDADPWHGWLMGFDATTLSHLYTFNSTPNASRGGIWMGGGAPSADKSGNLYVITGNGTFDAANSAPPNNDYGDTFLQLSSSLSVLQYFTPADQLLEDIGDLDFGSGGTSVVVDLPPKGSLPNSLVLGGGKAGFLCLLNRSAMGGFSSDNKSAIQMLNFGDGIFGTPAFWDWSFYLAGQGGQLQQFSLNPSTYQINPSPDSTSEIAFSFPGTTPSVSAMPDNSNAIVWALDNSLVCNIGKPGCGPTVLHAYDATNLANELWNSSQVKSNIAGYAVKFTVPTVANGKVYVGTRGNDDEQTPASIAGELDVYGLLPN